MLQVHIEKWKSTCKAVQKMECELLSFFYEYNYYFFLFPFDCFGHLYPGLNKGFG